MVVSEAALLNLTKSNNVSHIAQSEYLFFSLEDISSSWNHPCLLTSGPVPFDHATFVHATFFHATSVCATFVHATSVRAKFFHTTFVQGQNLFVYKCNHSCLDQTIKFQTTYTLGFVSNLYRVQFSIIK